MGDNTPPPSPSDSFRGRLAFLGNGESAKKRRKKKNAVRCVCEKIDLSPHSTEDVIDVVDERAAGCENTLLANWLVS